MFQFKTFRFFVKDHIKSYFVTLALSLPIIALLIYIIKAGGDYFFVYAWIFMTVITLVTELYFHFDSRQIGLMTYLAFNYHLRRLHRSAVWQIHSITRGTFLQFSKAHTPTLTISFLKGELRTKIEGLAQSLSFPLYKLYVVEGSKVILTFTKLCLWLQTNAWNWSDQSTRMLTCTAFTKANESFFSTLWSKDISQLKSKSRAKL